MMSSRDFRQLSILRLPERSPWRAVARRIALALSLVLAVAILLWLTRDGLRDSANPDQVPGFVAIFYFTTVSLATVGYGDIAPVTEQARLLNALLLTPVRVFVWLLFLGTAYELSLLRFRFDEEYRMRQLRERLAGHVIVCGFGVKGRAIVKELLAHGHRPQDIVVIDPVEAAIADAAAQGLVALRGDASAEKLLRAAVVERAAYVLAAPDRDDACVLICLTVRSLVPTVPLIAAAREEENVKLLYRAGANVVVSPSVSGGRLMAAAVRQQAVPQFLDDLLTFGHGVDAAERVVRPEEQGLSVRELPDLERMLVLGIARGERRYAFHELADCRLEPGDVVVYLTANRGAPPCP